MVSEQLVRRGIRDMAVLEAFRQVPREHFVPAALSSRAYEDAALPIEEGQTISQPYMVAFMLEALRLQGRERVLEVGTGSGYAAALLARLARTVWSIERLPNLAAAAARRLHDLDLANVHVLCADGTLGLASEAPFDAIVVAAGGTAVPPALVDQLAVGGRLVIPVGNDRDFQTLRQITRERDGGVREENLGLCRFVPLIAGEAPDE